MEERPIIEVDCTDGITDGWDALRREAGLRLEIIFKEEADQLKLAYHALQCEGLSDEDRAAILQKQQVLLDSMKLIEVVRRHVVEVNTVDE